MYLLRRVLSKIGVSQTIPNLKNYQLSSNNNSNQDSNRYKNKRVLLVDDSLVIIKVMRRWLESNGCIVTSAENGKVALELLKLHSFDITFIDFLMVRFLILTLHNKVIFSPFSHNCVELML